MQMQQARQVIEKLPVLFDFSDNQKYRIVNALMACAEIQDCPDRTCLLVEGDAEGNAGYVLLSGELLVETSDGFRKTVLPPVLLGEMRQFDFESGHGRSATVTAHGPVTVLRFAWSKFDQALQEQLEPAECGAFARALQMYAWMHYLEQEDEL